jgi:hypothetical protein
VSQNVLATRLTDVPVATFTLQCRLCAVAAASLLTVALSKFLPGGWMSIEPAETPEPRRTNHRGWDLLASFVAITISAASLYTAYHTSHSMERLVHASSWPALQLDSSNETAEGAATLSFDIHNTGVGPAQIHDFKILVDGQPVSSQGWVIDNLTKACCKEARAEALATAGGNRQAMLGPDTTNRVASRSLAPNEWISAIRWPKTDSNAVLWGQVDLARQSGRIQMRACYCSVFDECWAANSHKFPQQPVRSCI